MRVNSGGVGFDEPNIVVLVSPGDTESGMFEKLTRIAFGVAGIFLMALATGLILFSVYRVGDVFLKQTAQVGAELLQAVGYTIIAIAVFDVGKYLIEEEAIRAREMRKAGETRRSLTKFISTITIAVFLEALVLVFETGREDARLMLYPTLLLLVGVAMIVGLGVFQRLSASVEQDVAEEGSKER